MNDIALQELVGDHWIDHNTKQGLCAGSAQQESLLSQVFKPADDRFGFSAYRSARNYAFTYFADLRALACPSAFKASTAREEHATIKSKFGHVTLGARESQGIPVILANSPWDSLRYAVDTNDPERMTLEDLKSRLEKKQGIVALNCYLTETIPNVYKAFGHLGDVELKTCCARCSASSWRKAEAFAQQAMDPRVAAQPEEWPSETMKFVMGGFANL